MDFAGERMIMQPQPLPTQAKHPWRATVRTAVAALVALLPLVPVLVDELGIGGVAWVASVVAVAGAVTRVLAIPGVNAWVTEYVPWLAPAPRQP